MIKKIIIMLIIIISIPIPTFATEDEILKEQSEKLNIKEFIDEANDYTKEGFEDFDVGSLLSDAIKGKVDNKNIFSKIMNAFGKEIVKTSKTMVSIIIVIVVHALIKSISDNLENKSISQIAYYVQYILIVTIIMNNFSEITKLVTTSIENLVGFSCSLLPILMTLMVTTGNITSASVIQPILLFLITFIGNIISKLLLPLILIGTTFGIISKVSDKCQIDKMATYFKKSVVWALGVVLTIFVGVVSLEGTLSSSVDGLTTKTTKAVVSNFVPVVGKILSDAVDTVIGCSNILKNAVGTVGVIVIIGICIVPIIKLSILMLTYYITSAVCQPIAEPKIVDLLEQIGGTFKILLAMLVSVAIMLIIGVTLVIKISNSGLMYR